MGDVRKIDPKPQEALGEIKLPEWIEKALEVGIIAAAAAFAEGLADWAASKK